MRSYLAKREKERKMQHKKQLDAALNQVEPELSDDDLSMLSHAKAMHTANNPSSKLDHQINLLSSMKGNIISIDTDH